MVGPVVGIESGKGVRDKRHMLAPPGASWVTPGEHTRCCGREEAESPRVGVVISEDMCKHTEVRIQCANTNLQNKE